MNINITKEQARKYILMKQGLIGDYSFVGEAGVCSYIKQAGCIQFDPIDVCGKNHELVLQSRVKGFTSDMLYKLLYNDRKLVDYLDKNMSIFSIDDWPYFQRNRDRSKESSRGKAEINLVIEDIRKSISQRGAVCSMDLGYKEKINWAWAPTSLSRATLETLYLQGELIIHHKKGSKRYFDFASKYIPSDILKTTDPNISSEQYYHWHILRRIGAVGLLWNKASDAWLGITGLKSKERLETFKRLLAQEKIIEIDVEGILSPFYLKTEDKKYMDVILDEDIVSNRTELIAPLDNMMWDRNIIREIFDFDYKWEIYTPVLERKYGYYVLPVLQGDRFIARVEILRSKKEMTIIIKNLWWEAGIIVTEEMKALIEKCLLRFAIFNGCENISEIPW
jgi:uncharacterized protein